MKQLQLFFILFTFAFLLFFPSLTAASLDSKTAEIPYQIQNSDRIILGTVSDIKPYSTYTTCTITVKEWLYNPLPIDTINVETRIGTNVSVEDEAEFTKNESVLLMLKDIDLNNQLFVVTFGFPGKHPISDRDVVIKELQAQGKWQEGNHTVNETNNAEMSLNAGIISNQKENKTENMTIANEKAENSITSGNDNRVSNTSQNSNRIPFISPIWILVIMLMVVVYVRKVK